MMNRRRLLVLMSWCVLAVAGVDQVSAQQMRVEVIDLYARNADEMVRLLRPMLVPGGTIRGFRDKLVISTTPQNLADLRRILDQIDVPPHQLLITLRQDVSSQSTDRKLDISGSVGGEHARVTVPGNSTTEGGPGRSSDTDNVNVRIESNRSELAGASVQTFRASEGEPAFISTGESVPIRVQSAGGGRPVEYHNVVSGFYAVVRLQGERVTIQLASRADTVIDHASGAAHIERVSSAISGRLGEWLEVGAVARSAQQDSSGTIYHQSTESGDQRRTYIKVEELK